MCSIIYKLNFIFIIMISDYIKLIKFRYHLSFILVILGALFFAPKINFSLFISLLLVYFSFNVLMYTGLYTLNDIADRKSDSLHPLKKYRVICSGRISLIDAWIFSIFTIFTGLLIAFFAFRNLFYIYLIFIGLNIFYTHFAKKVPYLELVGNSFTYPLRFVIGILLVSSTIPINLVIACFFVAVGGSSERRIIELSHDGYEARKVLLRYTKNKLSLIQLLSSVIILIFFFIDFPKNWIIYSLFILFYLIFILILGYNQKLRPILNKLWLN